MLYNTVNYSIQLKLDTKDFQQFWEQSASKHSFMLSAKVWSYHRRLQWHKIAFLTGRWSVADGAELAGNFDKASDHVSLLTATPSARGTADELAGYTLTAFGITCIWFGRPLWYICGSLPTGITPTLHIIKQQWVCCTSTVSIDSAVSLVRLHVHDPTSVIPTAANCSLTLDTRTHRPCYVWHLHQATTCIKHCSECWQCGLSRCLLHRYADVHEHVLIVATCQVNPH